MLARRQNRRSTTTAVMVQDPFHHFDLVMQSSSDWTKKRPGRHQPLFQRKLSLLGHTSSTHHKELCCGGTGVIFDQICLRPSPYLLLLLQLRAQEKGPIQRVTLTQRQLTPTQMKFYATHTLPCRLQDSSAPERGGYVNQSTG